MESLIDSKNGVTVLLAGLIIMLALHLFLKLGEFIFKVFEKKEELKESTMVNLKVSIDHLSTALATNIQATHILEDRMRSVEGGLSEFSKVKTNVRQAFAALKFLAGEDWPKIKKEIIEDNLTT